MRENNFKGLKMNKKILDKIFHCIVVEVMVLMIGIIPIILTIAETIRLYF